MSVTRYVIFKSSAFNTTERRPYFINDGCFGDDLARWFISELRRLGFQADDEPGQEDFGWYINFRAGEQEYCLLISYRPGVKEGLGDWICTLERRSGVGPIGFLFGAAKRGIQIDGPRAIQAVLASSKDISDIRWYDEKDFGNEQNARSEPSKE